MILTEAKNKFGNCFIESFLMSFSINRKMFCPKICKTSQTLGQNIYNQLIFFTVYGIIQLQSIPISKHRNEMADVK